jgi:hypothetical protein
MHKDDEGNVFAILALVILFAAALAGCTWYAGRTDEHLRCVLERKSVLHETTRKAHDACIAEGMEYR